MMLSKQEEQADRREVLANDKSVREQTGTFFSHNHLTDKSATGYTGEKMHDGRDFHPVKFGNEVALNVGKGGCGTGRTLYGQSGSQGTHGATNPGSPRPNSQRDALENE